MSGYALRRWIRDNPLRIEWVNGPVRQRRRLLQLARRRPESDRSGRRWPLAAVALQPPRHPRESRRLCCERGGLGRVALVDPPRSFRRVGAVLALFPAAARRRYRLI